MASYEHDDDELQSLYLWVDDIPLSRPKRNITRDFSDGVLMAEAVHHFYPRLVDLHNYSAANSVQQKMYNWQTLQQKVFRKLRIVIPDQDVKAVASCVPGAVESVLLQVQKGIHRFQTGSHSRGTLSASGSGPLADFDGATLSPQPSEFETFQQPEATYAGFAPQTQVDDRLLLEKEAMIQEQKETIEILEVKVRKLQQLVRLKDSRIQALTAKLLETQPEQP
jgi:hypothetical protein